MSVGWTEVPLGDLASKDRGSFVDGPFGSRLKASEYVSVGIPVLRIQNVRPNLYDARDQRYITAEKADALARHDYRPGDVVITKLGDPCCVACQVPREAAAGIIVADVVRFRGQVGRIDHRYLVHFLNSPLARHRVAKAAKGTTRQRVNLSDMKVIQVPLPRLPEQRRIAAILDKADAIRRKRKEAIRLAEDLLQSTYLELVGSGHPDYETWPKRKIADLADPGKGSMRTGPFGSTLRHSEFVDSGIAVLGIDNAVQNHFSWSERRFVTPKKYDGLRQYTVKPGDVIITIMGTTGRSAVVPDDIPVAISTKHLATITVNRSLVEPEFLSNAIHRDALVLHQIASTNRGAIMAGLNLGLIKELDIRLPPLDLQRRFAEAVGTIRGSQARMEHLSCAAEDLFDSLADRAFRGEL